MAKKYIMIKSPFNEDKTVFVTVKTFKENPVYRDCEALTMGTKKEFKEKGWIII